MNDVNGATINPDVMHKAIKGLGLDEEGFAILLSSLGDKREKSVILKNILHMIDGDISIPTEMLIILNLLQRARFRASRIAEAIDWEKNR